MNYKAGDRIKCISLPAPGIWFDGNPITLGKIYICVGARYSQDAAYIINDRGGVQGYNGYRFTKLNELSKNITVL
jgi:hypothetical protein